MHARTSLTERLLMFWSTRFDAAVTESLRRQEFVSSLYMRRWYSESCAPTFTTLPHLHPLIGTAILGA